MNNWTFRAAKHTTTQISHKEQTQSTIANPYLH